MPRGSQIQAYLSTDVDRIMVAKPLTECNIVFFQMFLQGTPMSSTLLLVVSTRFLVRMQRGCVATYFVLLLPADVLPCNRTNTEQPVGGFVCVSASCVSSQLRERRCPRMVRTQSNAQLSLIVQCRVLRHPRPRMLSSVSEIGLHGGPLSSARWFLLCFLMIVRECSPHVGANQCPRNWRT